MEPTADLLEVGRIHKAHGLRGEVVVSLVTDRVERLAPGAELWADGAPHVVSSSSPHQQRWIVRFEGVSTREAADALRGAVLTAAPLAPDEGAMWVHELVGAIVELPGGERVGVVESVQDNPAHELLVLDSGALVPVVFVTDAAGLPERVVIDPPDGLLDPDLLG